LGIFSVSRLILCFNSCWSALDALSKIEERLSSVVNVQSMLSASLAGAPTSGEWKPGRLPVWARSDGPILFDLEVHGKGLTSHEAWRPWTAP